MAVLGSTKCWQHRPQLGQLCIPKPETGQERPGFPGRVRPVSPGTGQTWVLQASDSCWSCQHYPNPPLPPPLCLPDTIWTAKSILSCRILSICSFPGFSRCDIFKCHTENHLESLSSFCCQLHLATGVYFFHYSSSESPSFPAAHVGL